MYQITLTNGTLLRNIPDNTLDHSTSLTLVGQNFLGYGTIFNDNFVRLLESGANTTVNAPTTPLVGQLWFDTTANVLSIWGTDHTWHPIGIASGLAPLNSPSFTGIPTTAATPSPTDNSLALATTAFVHTAISTVSTGVVTVLGVSGTVVLSDLTAGGVAPINNPSFTGVPTTATTPTVADNSLKLATTAFVQVAVGLGRLVASGLAPVNSPSFTGTPVTATSPSPGDNSLKLATTAFVANGFSSIPTGDSNLLVNPTLLVQQMNPPFTPVTGTNLNNVYFNDGWLVNCVGTPSVVAQTVPVIDASRDAIGDESAQFAFQISTSGVPGVNDYALISQRLENNYRFANKKIVVSFWGYSNVVSTKVCIEFVQNFGTGGSPNANVTGIGQIQGTIALSNIIWTHYTSAPISIPSVDSKSFGTDPHSDYLAIRIWLTAGTTIGSTTANNIGSQAFLFTMWNPQLQIGTVATNAQQRPFGTELGLCQRYYQTGQMYNYGLAPSSSQIISSQSLPTTMRITPALSSTFSVATGITSHLISGADPNTIIMSATTGAGAGAYAMQARYIADARL